MELSSTFCSNHYGERIQESADMLCVYIITEKCSCTLTSTKPQINYIPTWQKHEITEKKGNKRNYLFHCLLPLTWGSNPIPGAGGLVPMAGLGWGYDIRKCALNLDPYDTCTVGILWLGPHTLEHPEKWWHDPLKLEGLGKSHIASGLLVLGSQFKGPPWRVQPPRQATHLGLWPKLGWVCREEAYK